ncbi:MAG TPA: NADP-specific glutamate dehydrogenase, partial [Treponemataceae bacterium]|nr:NADP-specific glutamate dehydrogenase [Treponemataceae bacterium]
MSHAYIEDVLAQMRAKNSHETEFIQAVAEVLETLEPVITQMPELQKNSILERMVEPERVLMFRVPWVNDAG